MRMNNFVDEMARMRAMITESVDAIPDRAQDSSMDNDLAALMKKYGVMEEAGCNMTAEGEECPVHGMSECSMMPMAEAEDEKPDKDGDNIPDWADKHPNKAGGDEDRKDESIAEAKDEEEDLEESMNITLDGPEADAIIHRLLALAGQTSGQEECPTCGSAQCGCSDDVVTMENADNDYGHTDATNEGEPVDPGSYMWDPDREKQRFVRSLGDNALDTPLKEDTNALYAKLKKDYRTYVAEADLARSNTGNESPLTATDRDEFDKDPFAGEEPDTTGQNSPLTTIKRQKVNR